MSYFIPYITGFFRKRMPNLEAYAGYCCSVGHMLQSSEQPSLYILKLVTRLVDGCIAFIHNVRVLELTVLNDSDVQKDY